MHMIFKNLGNGKLILTKNEFKENPHIKAAQASLLSLLDTLDSTITAIEETSSPDSLEIYIKKLNKLKIERGKGFYIPIKIIEELNEKTVEEVHKMKELKKIEEEKMEKERKRNYAKILETLPEL